ncbi:(Na+)-NQR maturation NqrM [Marinomonas sp. M1K-6]|uniref:(Na+)-NQR maturation NqrM n=1 Tax=Marinomonas profundi TaxID=2726122 RepID=A0A847R449_9GAMM|nr:(Na+)-NQR maturation NqrM [Marinomonas profundi]NLQ16776.1 (Na+)-NQR maturation NqrM [Marinomonas profundi]UDV02510.1 (Na+)-NQR maturation NqrM [Marinomonas profundi]
MLTIVLAFILMLLLVAAMSVGVLMGRKPISGSCGGMSSLGMEVACDICGGDKGRCEKETKKNVAETRSEDTFYDASK